MKTFALSGEKRETLGKSDASKLRKDGQVPCVLYGKNDTLLHFHTKVAEFNKLIYTPDVYEVKLNVSGDEFNALLKAVQYHPVTDEAIHADFLQLTPGEKVIFRIPVKVTGNSPGVMQGGNLVVKTRRLRVKALPKDLPEFIEVNIDTVKLGDSIKVKDLDIENLEFMDPGNSVVLAVKMSRVAMMTEALEAEAEVAPVEAAEGGEAAAPAEGGEEKAAEAGEAKAEGGE